MNPTPDFYEEFLGDILLGRDHDNGYATKQGRVGRYYSRSKKQNKAYSTLTLPVQTTGYRQDGLMLFYNRQFAHMIVGVMSSGKRGVRVQLGGDGSYQWGNNINISIRHLNEDCEHFLPTINDTMDVTGGLTIHEMCHVVFDQTKIYPDWLKKSKFPVEMKLKKSIHNIILDEATETKGVLRYPGYRGYIERTKIFMFEQLPQVDKPEEPNNPYANVSLEDGTLEDAQEKAKAEAFELANEMLNCLLATVRYPAMLTKEIAEKHEELIRKYIEILTPYPMEHQEIIDACEAVYELFLDVLKDHMQSVEEMVKEMCQSGKFGEENEEGGSELPQTIEELEDWLKEQMEEMAEQLIKIFTSGTEEDGGNEEESGIPVKVIKHVNKMSDEELEQSSEVDITPEFMPHHQIRTHWVDPDEGSLDTYYALAEEMLPYSVSLAGKLEQLYRNVVVKHSNLLSGTFDDHLVTEAIIGQKNINYRKYHVTNRGGAIGVLIDESGSMGYKQMKIASKLGIMTERAVRDVPVLDFFQYGHTTEEPENYNETSGRGFPTEIRPYFEGKGNGKLASLTANGSRVYNRDGHAIIEVSARMRRLYGNNGVIFLLCVNDGQPSGAIPYGFNNALEYTRECVKFVKQRYNVIVIQIQIQGGMDSAAMFDHYIKFQSFEQVVRDTANLVIRLGNQAMQEVWTQI
jgi:molybdopterin converting factor small subunit